MSARDDDMITPRDDGAFDRLEPTWTTDGHLDDGTIEAWLDRAFDDASVTVVESHVRGCAPCAARAAEARGFIAGASRIVHGLDAVPAGVVPQADVARTASRIVAAADATRTVVAKSRPPRPWYMQPVTRAAAALLVTVGGGAYVLSVGGADNVMAVVSDSSRMRESPAAAPSAPMASPASAAEADRRADSAVGSNRQAGAPADTLLKREAIAKRNTPTPRSPQALADAPRANSAASDMVAATRERALEARALEARAIESPPPVAVIGSAPVVAVPPPLSGKAAGMRIETRVAGGMASGVSAGDQRGGGVVTGLVVDPSNTPVEGASVVISGTTIGTTTNARGEFALRSAADTALLLVRRVGYEPSRLTLGTRSGDTARTRVMLNVSSQRLASVVVAQAAPTRLTRDESTTACWEVKATEPLAASVLPRALSAGELSSRAPEPGTWIGWPVAGATATVTFVRDAGGSLTASAEARDLRLVLVLLPLRQGWEGTATQTRSGATNAIRVRLVSVDGSMCKP